MNRQRLYRCRHDQRIAGVAGGVAEYFDLDPSIVRVLWVVSVFFGGFTLLAYIVMALIVPMEPETMPAAGPWQPGSDGWGAPQDAAAGSGAGAEGVDPAAMGSSQDATAAARADWHARTYGRRARGGWFGPAFGILLIILGGVALVDQLFPGWNTAWVWPGLIVAVGILLVVRSARQSADER